MHLLARRIVPIRRAAWLTFAAALALSADAETVSGPEFTNALGMEFARLDAGTITLGNGDRPRLAADGSLDYDMQPAHAVTLSGPVYLLKGKVTESEYRRSGLPGSAGDISWQQAAAFCEWLSRREGRRYRLPTEAEFEKARQNPPPAVHLDGREWVGDWHGIYAADPVTDPIGPATGMTRVIRDGARRFSLSPDASGARWGLPAAGFRVVLEPVPPAHPWVGPPPFSQSAVRQSREPVSLGPDPAMPYFTVRFALPIPPTGDTNLNGWLTGLDPSVLAHNHSPGFEILPNGDALAIYFSTAEGQSESAATTCFIQARLRFGAEEWDPPELFFDFKGLNDQSALLWKDGDRIWFFGGGRGVSAWLPFKIACSTDNGAIWTLTLPRLDSPATDFTAQPITSAFRAPGGAIYFTMDGAKSRSFLWRSDDDGIHWRDMGGRTGGRHSAIIPLDDKGNLLSIGGKNSSVNGWAPENRSADWGATWSSNRASPFPALGNSQRPCLIRLADGNLLFTSDSYNRKKEEIPKGWTYGFGCFVALSTNNGVSWRIKRLPVELPHEIGRKFGTLGYVTARQAPNGVIHLLATKTRPCLHYELNEAWIMSDAGDIAPETGGGTVRNYRENYPGGALHATWSARICPHGRYLLDGLDTTFYPNGRKEHEAIYANGRKSGVETFWASDGTKLWTWTHDPANNRSTWTQYWRDGSKRVESTWNTRPRARDLARNFFGLMADGPVYRWNRDGSPSFKVDFVDGSLR